jgi:hypothetical protein
MSDDSKIRDGEVERVGYGRPPKHTRFQKGNLANPRGRGNRDREDFAKSVESTLSAKVEIREPADFLPFKEALRRPGLSELCLAEASPATQRLEAVAAKIPQSGLAMGSPPRPEPM